MAVKMWVPSWTVIRRTMIVFAILGIIALVAVVSYVAHLSRGLPDHTELAKYEPAITSRVHAGDGALIHEFANEHRVFVPYESIPSHVVNAFTSAEDKKFFTHGGIDWVGTTRGVMTTVGNKLTGQGGMAGGSTISQQVAKLMLLTRDRTVERKIKEMVITRRMEKVFSKEKIMELYLNEIYLGGNGRGENYYGVGSAALNYFGKSLPQLDLAEAATLAALAQLPGAVNPYSNPERLVVRRNYVLGRMANDGHVSTAEADAAKALPLSTIRRLRGPEYNAAAFFVEEVRRELVDRYGNTELEAGEWLDRPDLNRKYNGRTPAIGSKERKELVAQLGREQLFEGGLSIRSTIDTRLQLAAQDALQNGLEAYDRRHGYRGPFATIDLDGDISVQMKTVRRPGGYGDWEAAAVVSASANAAKLILVDGAEVDMAEEDAAWAQQTFEREGGGKGLRPGDVVLAEVARETEAADAELLSGREDQQRSESALGAPIGKAILRQVPEVDGAVMAMDPHTGRILAMAGGYSFWKNQYNRATQAVRQPGSAFKPFVYAAALEQGYTPVSKILDAPFVNFDVSTDDYWAPQNYTEGRFYGLQTMRLGLEKSRNTMTVRLAQDIGMEPITELAERVGLYDDLDPYLAMSIGAGETTMVRMMRAYAALVNGGVAVEPTILDRVQNRNGDTIYRHDERACETCNTDAWDGEMPPALSDDRRPVLDPVIAYQVTHMLEGVVERGTGRRAQRVGKPLAGKTGTTNDYFDAWFMGMSPDLVVGVWTGFDTPKTLGNGESGGAVAAPIFTEFMEAALENEPALPFRIPPGVRLVEVDATTGQLAAPGAENTILEAFRPGTEPGVAFDEDNAGLNLSGGGAGLFGDLSVDEDGEEGDEEDDESPLVLDSSSPY